MELASGLEGVARLGLAPEIAARRPRAELALLRVEVRRWDRAQCPVARRVPKERGLLPAL